ncbi:GNAT family N-acetyltransferase [Herbiconiux sp. KACC 21604]|uniref:GNAT family N-acetyltransferase n=1 Tax=unclassified Herbiconiux TaxID=2618217 RepID=UPI001490BB3F|nr:GNAT family N-acetyltransferase [Herbiconiux sp. SALV-R1]QJU53214.1 N-acetyltransferase [Herbiconiux sp. SALV-R1]WPO88164.1 GNAT family N-acetyltransferase [Herbiconiux sp. KACC 21604]
MSDNNETEVVHQPERHRYVLEVDGHEVGFTGYTDRHDKRVFLHTEIDPAEGGKGYGSILIKGALSAVREDGLKAVGICPFVDAYVKKHHDFDDIVEPASVELRASL